MIKHDLHRYALHHLGEVARGIVRRQQRKLLAARRRNTVDVTLEDPPGKRIHLDVHFLPGADVGKLGFLVVGDDVGGICRHDCHELSARLDILTDTQGAVADHAVDGRYESGVGQIQFGLILGCFGAVECSLRLGELGLDHVELLGRIGERCGIARHRRARGGDARGGLLRVLDSAEALLRKLGIALVVLLREGLVGLVSFDRCPGRVDGGLLGDESRLLIKDIGFGSLDLGFCLLETDLEVAIVDAGEDLPRLHLLVVAHEHGRDVAGDLRSNSRVVSFYVGVVRRHLEATDRPVPPAEIGPARQGSDGR